MIIVTGAAGFIGSNIVKGLNQRGITDILAVDHLTGMKFANLVDCQIADYLEKDVFLERLKAGNLPKVEAVFHQGACSDTTQSDGPYMMENNFRYTMQLFEYCQENRIQLIYASSAAVYGAGPQYVEDLQYERPLNVYGYSKFLFDQVLRRHLGNLKAPVVGLRYFNVYGPREFHKGRMSSVAFHNMQQFQKDGYVTLFGGYDGWGNGEQSRDFVYVDDVVKVNLFFFDHPDRSGVFNCGTGKAQPFNDVARAVVSHLHHEMSLEEMIAQDKIRYVEFPADLKGKYQSFTQADLRQLREAGYEEPFVDVHEGVGRYIQALKAMNKLPPKAV